MARPKRATGKPSLGPRDRFNIAVPEAVGDRIRDLADERGISFNTLISESLAAHLGVSLAAPPTEDQLPLSA